MKFARVIEAAIKELKGTGFWCVATEQRMRNLVTNMQANGIQSDSVIADLLLQMWTMVSAEYSE